MILITLFFFAAAFNNDVPFQQAYLNNYAEIAKQEMKKSGIPASIKLAQGMLESNYGRSELATLANNHFGIKCGNSWAGKGFYRKDDDYDRKGQLIKSCFRVFSNAKESYSAHSDFITDPNKAYRYGFLFNLPKNDYKAWAHGLKSAGYATDPSYPDKLIYIIEKYELYLFDNEVLSIIVDESLTSATNTLTEKKSNISPPPAESITTHKKPKVRTVYSNKRIAINVNNGSRYTMGKEGEIAESFANRVGLSLGDIIMFNDHLNYPTDSLDAETPIYLEHKNRDFKGDQLYHLLKKGETLSMISQKYGIRLSTLHTLNRISKNAEPIAGEKISLKHKVKSSKRPKCKRKEVDQFIF
jgi:flagellum-specific peptidoglycan hydrolase FlgJ